MLQNVNVVCGWMSNEEAAGNAGFDEQ